MRRHFGIAASLLLGVGVALPAIVLRMRRC